MTAWHTPTDEEKSIVPSSFSNGKNQLNINIICKIYKEISIHMYLRYMNYKSLVRILSIKLILGYGYKINTPKFMLTRKTKS